MRFFIAAAAALFLGGGMALADPIEGLWKRPNGILVKISACGSSFCVIGESGAHKGETAGKMAATGSGRYAGTVTDLESGKTYSGKASLNGAVLQMSGCVLGLFCRSEDWSRP